MTEQIERVIAKGKPLAVIQKLIKEELLRQDRAKFYKTIREEYEALGYWVDEVIKEATYDEDGELITEEVTQPKLKEGCPTLEEYINETRVITEAVNATYDEDGMILTEAVAEVTELVRPYVAIDATELETMINTYLEPTYTAVAKNEIREKLDTLTITTSNGNVFDANLQARVDMADAIMASDTLGITEKIWRMADNSEVMINITELREAHALAIQAYATLKGIGV